MMVWGLPRKVTQGDFDALCKSILGPYYEKGVVTASRHNSPYGWFVMDKGSESRLQKACALEIEMQRKWGQEVHTALSRCRLQRIRMND